MALWLKILASVAKQQKFIDSGPTACWLWIAGLGHCREACTDGHIPKLVVPGLVPGMKAPWKHAAKLVETGLWREAVGGYQVHDYLDWNPSKAEIEELRRQDIERKREKRGLSDRNPDGIRADLYTRAHAGAGSGSALVDLGSGSSYPEDFEIFWTAYPHKTGKGAAFRAWTKLKPTAKQQAEMVVALSWQVNQPAWLRDGGQYVPHPATWLNRRSWEDEPFSPLGPEPLPVQHTKAAAAVDAFDRADAALRDSHARRTEATPGRPEVVGRGASSQGR